MLQLARFYVKTSLLFLALGLMIGVHMSATFLLRRMPPNAFLIQAHTHLLLVGFVLMMIMGVALWMFPKAAKDDTHFRPGLAWFGYVTLAAATAIRATGELSLGFLGSDTRFAVLFLGMSTTGGGLQALGGIVFAWNIWTRIRAVSPTQR